MNKYNLESFNCTTPDFVRFDHALLASYLDDAKRVAEISKAQSIIYSLEGIDAEFSDDEDFATIESAHDVFDGQGLFLLNSYLRVTFTGNGIMSTIVWEGDEGEEIYAHI